MGWDILLIILTVINASCAIVLGEVSVLSFVLQCMIVILQTATLMIHKSENRGVK